MVVQKRAVIIDSNIFVRFPREDDAHWVDFRDFQAKSNCVVLIPNVVLIELSRRLYDKRISAAEELIDNLNKAAEELVKFRSNPVEVKCTDQTNLDDFQMNLENLSPKLFVESLPEDRLNDTKSLIKRLTGCKFTVLSTPSIPHDHLVHRCCVDEKRPFRTKQDQKRKEYSDSSYRDTLIWFSVLEEVNSLKWDIVSLISTNYKDFSNAKDTDELHKDLADELINSKCHVEYFQELKNFLSSVYIAEIKEKRNFEDELEKSEWLSDSMNEIAANGVKFEKHFLISLFNLFNPEELGSFYVRRKRLLDIDSVREIEENRLRVEARLMVNVNALKKQEHVFIDIPLVVSVLFYLAKDTKKLEALSVDSVKEDEYIKCGIHISFQSASQLLIRVKFEDTHRLYNKFNSVVKFQNIESISKCLLDLNYDEKKLENLVKIINQESPGVLIDSLSAPCLMLCKWKFANTTLS